MTQHLDVERLAEQAGLVTGENQRRDGVLFYRSIGWQTNVSQEDLGKFAALVLEEAAKLAEQTTEYGAQDSSGETRGYASAAAIRALAEGVRHG